MNDATTRFLDPDELAQLRDLAVPHGHWSDRSQEGNEVTESTATDHTPPVLRIAVVSAGVSDPSTTRLLADRLAQRVLDRLHAVEVPATAALVDLAPLAVDIAQAGISGLSSTSLRAATDTLAQADGLIAATPVYKAGVSGLFKSFIDILDNDLLIAKPVIVAATAGSPRHALVADEHMRPLFAFMRALTTPTSLSVSPDDWASPELGTRLDRAATEMVHLVRARVADAIADDAWKGYQHQFAGEATRASRSATDIDFSSSLMQVAAGGSLVPRPSRDE
ncbi:NAD(P)H-dependent oxidoreductase [Streptomyces sp. NBC_00353]|uniref:CE1759 family FMN reductase n=1 Tax=Streptomyces sp. NBC_00353 TaxID=2975722 RepID=UPI002E26D451